MGEMWRKKLQLLNGWEWFHLSCLSLFVVSLPIFDRISLSYIVGIWLAGTIIQKNTWIQLKENWLSSRAYRLFFEIFMFFILLLFFSALYSDNQLKGIRRFESHLSLLVIPIGLLLIKPIVQKYYRYLLWVFVAGNFLASLICWGDSFYEYFTQGIWNPYYVNFSNFLHPSYFALYLAFSVLFIWDERLKKKSLKNFKVTTFLYLALISIFSVTIIFLSSKAGIFAFSGMLLFLLGFEIVNRRNILRNLVLIFLVMITTLFVLKNNRRMKNLSESVNLIQSGEAKTKWSSTTCRFFIWESALASLNGNYLLGNGIGDSKEKLIQQYRKNDYEVLMKNRFDAHNQYLEIILFCGLGGLFLLLLYIGYSLFYAWKEDDKLMLGFLVLLGIHFFVETMLNKVHGGMFFAFFIHLLWIRMDCNPSFTIVWKYSVNKTVKSLNIIPSYLWRKVS